MWFTPETNQMVGEKLRNAKEYAQEGKDHRALWYLLEAVEIMYEEIEVRGDE